MRTMHESNNHYTILIIDDEEIVQNSCTDILASDNYYILTASDGYTGLERVKEIHPDLVFIDLKIPTIPGIEVIDHIYNLDPTIIIIVITGYPTVSSAVEAMKRGAYDFLPKPFTPEELRLIAKRGLEKRRLLLETMSLRREKELIRENFTDIVAHELKAPVSAVQQNILILLKGIAGDLNPKQVKILERMKGRITELLQMITTWLELSSINIYEMRERFQPLFVTKLIETALEILKSKASAKDIEIETDISSFIYPVHGDEGMLTEVFTNIIDNALKYSYAGSRIFIRVKLSKSHVFISVTDSGIGISKEDISFIFDDFYRARNIDKKTVCGAGIGLAICKRIITAHYGTINVASEIGVGSTFTVTLPIGQSTTKAHDLRDNAHTHTCCTL
ncbi:MAG: ATP-binding protein [bacterium]